MMDVRHMYRRLAEDVRQRREYYITLALGVAGWLIIAANANNITSLLPRYAEF